MKVLTRAEIGSGILYAPKRLAHEAAARVVGGAEICNTFDRFGTLISRARLNRNVGPKDFDTQFARASDDIWKAVDGLMAVEKKNPLKHLNVKPDAERAWDRFDKALERARLTGKNEPNCQDRPAEFADFDEENLPTAEQAYRLCHGDGLTTPKCPLLELCSVWAEQERPAWGVWAGEVWVNGEIVNNE